MLFRILVKGPFIFLLTFSLGFATGTFFRDDSTPIAYRDDSPRQKRVEFRPISWPRNSLRTGPIEKYPKIEQRKKPTRPICKDRRILPVWRPILRKATIQEWKDSIASHGVADCSKLFEVVYFNLNQRGPNEILVRANGGFPFCGATGNCSVWVFQKRGGRYVEILEAHDLFDVIPMGNQVLRSRSNGYHDLLMHYHHSASETGKTTYRWNGKRYAIAADLVTIARYGPNKSIVERTITCKQYLKEQERRWGAN